MKSLVPPAPVSAPRLETKREIASPLEAAFIARVYRSMAWFGALCAVLAAWAFPDAPGLGSFVGGLVLAGAMLRVQEVGVRALLQPKDKLFGMDAKLAMVLLLPLKFVALVLALVFFNALGWLRPGPLALGFFAAQLVLVAKFFGWLLARARAK